LASRLPLPLPWLPPPFLLPPPFFPWLPLPFLLWPPPCFLPPLLLLLLLSLSLVSLSLVSDLLDSDSDSDPLDDFFLPPLLQTWLQTQTQSSCEPLFSSLLVELWECDSELLLFEWELLDELELFDELELELVSFCELELDEVWLVWLELVVLDEEEAVLLASFADSSFFCLQEASYCFPFFLKEQILIETPASDTSRATAASVWHFPLSLDLDGLWT